MKILYSHLSENKRNLSSLTSKLRECKDDLVVSFGKIYASLLEHNIIKINRTKRIKSFKTKKKKLSAYSRKRKVKQQNIQFLSYIYRHITSKILNTSN